MNQEERYLAYLLRLWRESGGDPPGGVCFRRFCFSMKGGGHMGDSTPAF